MPVLAKFCTKADRSGYACGRYEEFRNVGSTTKFKELVTEAFAREGCVH